MSMGQPEIEILKNLVLVRLGQVLVNEYYKAGKFPVPIHLAIGHESIAVAVDYVMKKDDYLVLSHRNIHYHLAREKDVIPEIKEYLLESDGLAKGMLGSMNLLNPQLQIPYTSNVLGNNLAVGTGLALGRRVNKGGVTIVVTGDGAMEEGIFYESLLFMKSNNLSSIIIIENNGWSLGTTINERRCDIDVEKLCSSMDIEYAQFSGNNVLSYIEKLSQLREESCVNNKPVVVEVMLTSLGDWRLKTDEFPDGKFINYHAGPAPTIEEFDVIVREDQDDPIFIARELFSRSVFDDIVAKVRSELPGDLA
jgi:TPP-dependent pyruvate/acetoin dehydrogenase alpha subunit